jgi:alpha-tubulin suppressor-like RCC1 family protein
VLVRPLRNSQIVKVSAGQLHSAALSLDSKVFVWGDNSHTQHFVPAATYKASATGAAASGVSQPSSLVIFQSSSESDIMDIACLPFRTCVASKHSVVLSDSTGSFYKLHWSKHTDMTRLVVTDQCLGLVTALNQLFTLDLSALQPSKQHYKLTFRLDGIVSTTASDHAIGVTDRFGRAYRVYPDKVLRETAGPTAVKAAFASKHSLLVMPVFAVYDPPESRFDSLPSICEAAVHGLIVIATQNFWTAPELVDFAEMYQVETLRMNCELFVAQNLVMFT